MLPPCMFYEKFQVFGIHIYLQPYTELVCTSKPSNARALTTTSKPHHLSRQPPQRTIQTSIYSNANNRHGNNNENYAIEVLDRGSRSVATQVATKAKCYLTIISTLFSVFCLQVLYPR